MSSFDGTEGAAASSVGEGGGREEASTTNVTTSSTSAPRPSCGCPKQKDVVEPLEVPVLGSFQSALNAVYLEDEALFEANLAANPLLLQQQPDRSWDLIHYLYAQEWTSGIAKYEAMGGRVEDIFTRDWVGKLSSAIQFTTGGQSILHIHADMNIRKLRPKDETRPGDAVKWAEFEALCARYPSLNIPDFNGRMPRHYATAGQRTVQEYRDDARLVMARARNPHLLEEVVAAEVTKTDSLAMDVVVGGIQCFTITEELRGELEAEIATVPERPPNSMHKYGKVLVPYMDGKVKSLVKGILDERYHEHITHIHAFFVSYDVSKQTNLGLHVDDSTFTINICLSNTSTGCELVFDQIGFTHVHRPLVGIVHGGKIQHHVEDILSGERACIIIWVTCSSIDRGLYVGALLPSRDSTASANTGTSNV